MSITNVDYLKTPIGIFEIGADAQALIYLKLVDKISTSISANKISKETKRQLLQYFSGLRKEFELPLKFEGTEFQKLVWQNLIKISYGKTSSYSDIACTLGSPRAQRAVGSANRLNSLPVIVPCHRVITKRGSLGGYALGLDKKLWLLKHERSFQ